MLAGATLPLDNVHDTFTYLVCHGVHSIPILDGATLPLDNEREPTHENLLEPSASLN